MRVYVIGSTSFAREMVDTRDRLRELGVDGWIHPDYDEIVKGTKTDISKLKTESERAETKRQNNYLRVHYKHILASDAVLVVNLKKSGVEGYIGGNVLIEMGQAYVNDKLIFLLKGLPSKSQYLAEIECMDPICLNGDLTMIRQHEKIEVKS